MIAKAPTGMGKTLAFAAGTLPRLNPAVKAPQAIFLNNTRDLAMQTAKTLRSLLGDSGLRVQLLVPADRSHPAAGSVEAAKKAEYEALLKEMGDKNAELVVSCAGSLLGRVGDDQKRFKSVTHIVLDEADALVTDAQVLALIKALPKAVVDNAQYALFSATFPARLRDKFEAFANPTKAPAKAPLWFEAGDMARNIKQYYINCTKTNKDQALSDLFDVFGVGGSAMIFTERVAEVEAVAKKLSSPPYNRKVAFNHGQMDAAARNSVVDDYRSGRASVLITSNVLARGVDIPSTDFVVNLDIPVHHNSGGKIDEEMYTHRIGRAGRFGRNGIAISLVDASDLPRIRELEAKLSTATFQLQITELDPNGKDGPEGMKKQVEADLKKKK